MYAAVGSYIIQCWQLFDLKIRHHPPMLLRVVFILIGLSGWLKTWEPYWVYGNIRIK